MENDIPEPWPDRDRRRFWIAVITTLALFACAVIGAYYAFISTLKFAPPG